MTYMRWCALIEMSNHHWNPLINDTENHLSYSKFAFRSKVLCLDSFYVHIIKMCTAICSKEYVIAGLDCFPFSYFLVLFNVFLVAIVWTVLIKHLFLFNIFASNFNEWYKKSREKNLSVYLRWDSSNESVTLGLCVVFCTSALFHCCQFISSFLFLCLDFLLSFNSCLKNRISCLAWCAC